ncbi:hypothetical protein F5X96DRAFT_647776 [Biscogniauxia mediterranea]|nr:hypothetical protein F5X96DRAFT_647776 [Biscogniauxia mediterranea]
MLTSTLPPTAQPDSCFFFTLFQKNEHTPRHRCKEIFFFNGDLLFPPLPCLACLAMTAQLSPSPILHSPARLLFLPKPPPFSLPLLFLSFPSLHLFYLSTYLTLPNHPTHRRYAYPQKEEEKK